MDPRDLKSASNYVNNQLASRGLVRGTPIDFARPSKDPENPARIINLVYELVQRRDRDAEQRESLAITIRTLRNSETKNNSTIESLNQRIAELERKHSIQEAQCRATASSLRAAESSAKSLRDETVRLKTHLAQVRTQCQNDIRKRDIELQKMKDRLLDSRRGNRPSASTIVVKGGPLSKGSVRGAEEGDAIQGNGLADDTADFLTQLSQALADENDSILALFRQCLSQLKALQGLPDDGHNPETEEEAEDAVNQVVAPPANFDSISREMEAVMSSLNEMINQPNYVPIEELAAKNEELAEKDDEIQLLQKRNDVLEAEWRKAIALMDETNRKLLESIKEPEQLQDSAESAEETEVSHRRQSRGNAGASRPRIAIVAELQVLRDHEAATGETPLRLRSWESERQPRAVPEPETQATQASEPEAVFEPQPLFATQPVVEEPQSEEAQEATQLPESETEVRKTRSKKATPKRRVSTRTRLPEAESEPAPQPGPEHAALTSAAPAETPKRRGNLRKRPEPEPEADCEPAPEPKSVPAATKATPKRRGNAIRTTEPEPEPEPMPEPGTEQDAVPPPIRVNPKRRSSARTRIAESVAEAGPAPVPVKPTPKKRGSARKRIPEPEPEPEIESAAEPAPEPVKATPKRRASARILRPVPEPRQESEHTEPASTATPKRRGNARKRPEPETEGEPAPEPKAVPAATKATPKRRSNTRARATEPEPEAEAGPEHQEDQEAAPSPIKATPKRRSVQKRLGETEPEQETAPSPVKPTPKKRGKSLPEPESEDELALAGTKATPKRRAMTPLPEPELEREPTPTATPKRRSSTRIRLPEPESEDELAPVVTRKATPGRRGSLRLRAPEPEPESELEQQEPEPMDDRDDLVLYKEEVIVVRTKSPAPSPVLLKFRPRSKPVAEVEPEPEPEPAVSKKRRRGTKPKPKPAEAEAQDEVELDAESPPAKKVKKRASKRNMTMDTLLGAAFK